MEYQDALQHLAATLDDTSIEALTAVFQQEAMEQMARCIEAELASPPDSVEAHRAAIRADAYDRCMVGVVMMRMAKVKKVPDAGGLS